jgi:hypothetical protein
MADYLLPKLPEKDKDGNIDVDSQMNFNKNVLQLLQKKISDDNVASSATAGTSTVAGQEYMKQMIQNHVIDIYDYTFSTTRASATILACFTTSITTTQTDSKVIFDALIVGEYVTDGALILERVVGDTITEIGSPVASGNRWYGISILPYDSSSVDTMSIIPIQYVDSPNVASGTTISYRLKVYGTGTNGFNVNHTVDDSDATTRERATSNVRLTEVGGTPSVTTDVTAIATVAEAIAGTNDTKIITPLKLRNGLNASGSAPIYACRAWVNFNGTGTVAIRASGNVSGITDNGTGDYTINFTTAMEDANYGVSLSNAEPSSPTADSVHNGIMYGQTTTSVRTRSWSWAGSVTDQPYQYVMVFR